MNSEHTRKYLNTSLRMKIFNKHKGVCAICGAQTRFFRSNYDTPFDRDNTVAGSVDHIIPVSHGGNNEESNLRWTCKSCNCSRGNRA